MGGCQPGLLNSFGTWAGSQQGRAYLPCAASVLTSEPPQRPGITEQVLRRTSIICRAPAPGEASVKDSLEGGRDVSDSEEVPGDSGL